MDDDGFAISGVFKTRTAFCSGILIWRRRGVNDLITSRHPRLSKKEEGGSFSSTRACKPKDSVDKTVKSCLVSIRSLEVMK